MWMCQWGAASSGRVSEGGMVSGGWGWSLEGMGKRVLERGEGRDEGVVKMNAFKFLRWKKDTTVIITTNHSLNTLYLSLPSPPQSPNHQKFKIYS